MKRKLSWFAGRGDAKGVKLRRLAWFSAAGAAAVGLGVTLVGIGAGVAAVSLVRRLGLRREEVRGKVVLITGSSRGLGFALAEEFTRLGARLVICARNPVELELARERLARHGAEVLAVRCDITVQDDVERLVREANARFGRVDILINNAGVIEVGPLQSQTFADFQEAMNVMFWGMVYPTLAVLPQMIARRSGQIANITSIGGKLAVPHLLPYNCAKFAAVGFSEGLHAEVAKDGVTVTTVVPGLMRTGSHVNAFFKGNNRAEYSLFSLGATLPLVSMNARRAAHKIVTAVRSGRSEIILTPQAKLAAMFNGVFPGITSDLMGLLNRMLPAGEARERHTGKESETAVTQSFITALGRRAAEEFNQFPERHEPRSGALAG
ncbi:MAG: SDR family NAD(P)-dependent oxidoreductase [Terriglobales bacterium]